MIRRLFVLMALVLATSRAAAQSRPGHDRVVFDSVSGQAGVQRHALLQGGATISRPTRMVASESPTFTGRTPCWSSAASVLPSRVSVPASPGTLAVELGAVRMRSVATRLDQIQVEAER